MLTLNINSSVPSGLVNFGRGGAAVQMSGFDAGMNSMQSLLSQSMTVMMGLMTLMLSQQAGLLGSGNFGQPSAGGQASPLNGFLGGLEATSSKGQGKRIPGGKSLYKGRGMFHKGAPGAPNTYAFENSPAGIAFAAKNGYKSIDIDMQITKDGVPVATHWSKPMAKDGFYDPLGKLGKNTKVSQITLAEVMRLRNKDGQSRIYPVAEMVKHLKKHGIAGDFEAKDDNRFATNQVMGYLAGVVRDSGIKANLKSIYRGERSGKILKMAQKHGFYARVALAKKGQNKYWGYA